MVPAGNYGEPGVRDGSSAVQKPPNQGAELALRDLLAEVRACRHCADLPLGPRPVLRAAASARVLIIGQAPGTRVHASGIPWDDPSGDRLRNWLELDKETFYDAARIAIMPMGFCYPGRGRGGDLPPRAECAPLWHGRILELLHNVRLTLLIGRHAQAYYLARQYLGGHYPEGHYPEGHYPEGYCLIEKGESLAARVRRWPVERAPQVPLVHPSPRNRRWLTQHPWFEAEVVPVVRRRLHGLLERG